MEGETTSFYIYRQIASFGVKVSSLARGLGFGDDLEYADELTLGRSIVNRQAFKPSSTWHASINSGVAASGGLPLRRLFRGLDLLQRHAQECVVEDVVPIAIVFGVVQTTLMALGWMFGDIFVGHVQRVASLIGFLLLLYVGGSMMLQAVRNKVEAQT